MRNHHLLTVLSAALAGFIGLSTTAQAENWADRVTISGFASAIFQSTDEEVYYSGTAGDEGINEEGSAQGTKLGLNISAQLNDRLNVASQLFAAADENYAVHVDWAFANFTLTDELGLKVGKVKYPVGLVNEYRDVGYAYPWLHTPDSIYSELSTVSAADDTRTAPSVTRESYDGFSLLWGKPMGDWTWEVNLFGGSVALEAADVKKLRGITVNLDWNDTVQFTASSYVGVMRNATGAMMMMNGKEHAVDLVGVKADWNNFIVYAESAQVDMEGMKPMSNSTGYITVGYRFGKLLPYYTFESFKNDAAAGTNSHTKYTLNTVGLRYELMSNTALKMDISMIDHKEGAGLFESDPDDNPSNDGDVMKYGIGVDYVF